MLPIGTPLPTCKHCSRELLLFLQFALPTELGLPFVSGSRLSIFMCSEHNEIPSFDQLTQLVDDYWDNTEGNWFGLLVKPSDERIVSGPELLEHQALSLDVAPDDSNYFIAVSGQPKWVQDSEEFTCSCGAPMQFVCQISDSYKFQPLPNAPEQPDSCYSEGYVLFLGNETYVFACPRQCNPRAVWITVQN